MSPALKGGFSTTGLPGKSVPGPLEKGGAQLSTAAMFPSCLSEMWKTCTFRAKEMSHLRAPPLNNICSVLQKTSSKIPSIYKALTLKSLALFFHMSLEHTWKLVRGGIYVINDNDKNDLVNVYISKYVYF